MGLESLLERQRRVAVGVASGLLVALGGVVLTGWALHNDRLMMVLPGFVSMKPNTALGFLLAGAALGLMQVQGTRARLAGRVLAVLAGLLGGLTLLEYGTGWNLGVDQAMFRDPLQFPFPGRMARISAANFCLAGLSLWLMARGGWARIAAALAEMLVLVTALVSVIGFLYGVPMLYGAVGVGGQTSMALHTGAGFLLLALAMLCGDAESRVARVLTSPQSGGWIGRRGLPLLLVFPIVLGWAYLRPALDIGGPRFGMALLAATLVVTGGGGLLIAGMIMNRAERERQHTAESLRVSAASVAQSERELRLVMDNLPTLISYLDAEGRFVRVNRTYETWLGRPLAEIGGRTARELLGEEYWRSTEEARLKAATGAAVTLETVYPTVRGARQVQVTYAPDFNEQGQLRGFACMVQDIQARRQAEAALLQSEKLAVVGRLASSIAHEINNPLEAVTNLLYLTETELASDHPAANYVALAQTELGRVSQIVLQTLKFHRQSSSATEAMLSELVEQVLVLHHGRLLSGRVAVETRFRETTPVLCREGEVRQVIANLIGNAADAMKQGGRLLVRTRSAEDGTTVTVADTGHGIPAAMRATLFEPFHSTKGDTGSGLGLWISRQIVDRHGGWLRVRSSCGEGASGTVFRMFVPRVSDAEAAGLGKTVET